MFPLNWNIPFIRKNGSRTTLGAITGDIAGLTDKTECLWANMKNNGAVNMLPITASSQVINGATFTVNADGTISVHTSGQTLTQNAQLVQNVTLPSGIYKQTGCPSGGSDSTYRIGGFDGNDYGNGRLISSDGTTKQLYFTVFSGMNIPANNPIVFKPMITVPSYNGDYVPYAKSNKELTEDVKTLSDTKISTATLTDRTKFTGTVAAVKHGRNVTLASDVKIVTNSVFTTNEVIASGLPLPIPSSQIATTMFAGVLLIGGNSLRVTVSDNGELLIQAFTNGSSDIYGNILLSYIAKN